MQKTRFTDFLGYLHIFCINSIYSISAKIVKNMKLLSVCKIMHVHNFQKGGRQGMHKK